MSGLRRAVVGVADGARDVKTGSVRIAFSLLPVIREAIGRDKPDRKRSKDSTLDAPCDKALFNFPNLVYERGFTRGYSLGGFPP